MLDFHGRYWALIWWTSTCSNSHDKTCVCDLNTSHHRLHSAAISFTTFIRVAGLIDSVYSKLALHSIRQMKYLIRYYSSRSSSGDSNLTNSTMLDHNQHMAPFFFCISHNFVSNGISFCFSWMRWMRPWHVFRHLAHLISIWRSTRDRFLPKNWLTILSQVTQTAPLGNEWKWIYANNQMKTNRSRDLSECRHKWVWRSWKSVATVDCLFLLSICLADASGLECFQCDFILLLIRFNEFEIESTGFQRVQKIITSITIS